MQLYFLRHAEAEGHHRDDYYRELTARGHQRTETAGKVMKRLAIAPTHIFSSPRIRARQTADIVAKILGIPVEERSEVDFGFNAQHVGALTSNLSSTDSILFVGHNPSMSSVVNDLCGADVNMKKGGLARIDLYTRKPLAGELLWLITPKVFDTLDK
jgi:phosphohistidine phosphatase